MKANGLTSSELRSNSSQPERQYYLDWVRVVGVMIVIAVHSMVIFGAQSRRFSWLKVEAVPPLTRTFFDLLAHFFYQHLPIFFVVAGMATWFSLRQRTPGQYWVERVKRLLVPVSLSLLFYPLMNYYRAVSKLDYQGSLLEFWPTVFEDMARFDLDRIWGHLWFLVYLFIFSTISLLLLLYLKSETARSFVVKLGDLSERKGAIFLLAIPIVLLEMTLRARWGVDTSNLFLDWASLASYLTFFIFGFLLAIDSRFKQAVTRHGWMAFGLGMVTFVAGLPWIASGHPNEYQPHTNLSPGWFLYTARYGFNAWFWIVFNLGVFGKYLDTNSKGLNYLNEACLPIYVVHLPLTVMIGFYVLQWGLGILPSFLIILLGTYVTSFLLYEFLIKRTNLTRILFGMRPKKKTLS